GDETRYAMYRELATSTRPLSAQELADRLGLHANTVRLHLDRLRETRLVEAEGRHRGTAGRPQHPHSLAPGAPTLGFAPPPPALPRGPPPPPAARRAPVRGRAAGGGGPPAGAPPERGEGGGAAPPRRTRARSCITALADELDRLGFEPAVGPGDGTAEGAVRI